MDSQSAVQTAWKTFMERLAELRAEQRAAIRAFGERVRQRQVDEIRKSLGIPGAKH